MHPQKWTVPTMWFSSLNAFIVNGRFTKISRIGFFLIRHAIPLGTTATGLFAHGRFGFSLHGRFHFLDRCWDFSKSRLKWILGSRVHRQLFWLLAGCFFYGNQSIFLVSGWMLFLWSSHIVDSVWTIFIVA